MASYLNSLFPPPLSPCRSGSEFPVSPSPSTSLCSLSFPLCPRQILSATTQRRCYCYPSPTTAAAFGCRAAMTEHQKPVSDNRMLVFVPPHPLIKHWISILRNEQTPCPIFKNAMAELGRLLMYEASRDWLPTISGEIQTPMTVAAVEFIDPREPVALINELSEIMNPFYVPRRPGTGFYVQVVPILRAGLALAEHAASILPATKTYHLGLSRDEETLQPTVYLNKLPESFLEGSRVLVIDPMLATGGTIVKAIDLIKERGVDNNQIKVISAVAAPPALERLSDKFPGLHVYTGTIDPTLNDKGFIVPGLGDAGDRSYGT